MSSNILHCSFCKKSSYEVEHLLEGPEIKGTIIYMCNECVSAASSAILAHDKKSLKAQQITPHRIKSELDDHVVGQEYAKKIISVAVHNHVLRLDNPECNVEKSNVLFIGPSGSGKTLILKTVAKFLGVPYVIASATSLTESGYTGNDVEDIISKLYRN
jgi:ATP-dependent Clp protease ATP-binding subunit ClpX